MGSQKWDETARCYRAHAALTCHWRGSMDRAARPRYEQRKLISQAWSWSVKNTPCTQTNTVKMLSIITTWLSKKSLEWYTYLGRFWGTLPSKMKVIHSSFSSSDVGRKWRILCSVVHPNTEHGIACETLLMLQLLKRWENKGQLLTTANGWNAGLSIKPHGLALRNVMSHCVRIKTAGLVRLTWFKGD